MFKPDSDRYSSVKPIHKAGFWIAAANTVFGIILLGLAFSFQKALTDLDNADNGDSSEDYVFSVFFQLIQNTALAAAICIIVTQVFALTGYGLMNKALVICYIVFSSCCVVVCVVCISIPAITSTILNTGCAALRADYVDYSDNSDYKVICVEMASDFNAVTAFMAILIALSFVQAVLGCVGASAIGRKEIVQTTYTTGPVTTTQTVMVAQPYSPGQPGQPMAYAQPGVYAQPGPYGQPVVYAQPPQGYVAYPVQGQDPNQQFYPPPNNAGVYPPPPAATQ